MKRVLSLLLLFILLASLSTAFNTSKAFSNNNVNVLNEELNIYSYGTVTLIELEVHNHPSMIEKFNDLFGFIENKSISITYYNVPKWSSRFNYLLSGVIFNDTILTKVPTQGLYIDLINTSPTDQVIGEFNDIFKTYFFKDENILVGYTDYGMFLSIYNKIISLPQYTRFLSWLDPTSFSPDQDVFMISFIRDENGLTMRVFVIKDLVAKYFYWSLDKFLKYRPNVPNIGYNYTSTLTIYFKDVFIEKKPSNITVVKEDNNNQLYIYRITARNNEEFINPKFKIRYETPILLLQRTFNSSIFLKDNTIQVELNVKNIMPYPVHNINITEATWWNDVGVLKEGNTTFLIKDLKAESEYKVVYRIKIETDEQLAVKIPPAKLILESATGYREIIYSNTNIIYLNYDEPPLISASVIDVNARDLSIGRTVKFVTEISNLGNATVHSVVLGEYIIGDLKPWEKRRVEEKRTITTIGGNMIEIGLNASYMYQDNEYNLSSQYLPVKLYPREYNRPWVDLTYDRVTNSSCVNATIGIKNKGLFNIKDLHIKVYPYKGEYVKGDLSSDLTYYVDTLNVNESIKLSFLLTYPNNTVSLMPQIVVYSPDLISSISSKIDYYYNSVTTSYDLPHSPYLVNENYTFYVKIENGGPAKLYNISISFSNPEITVNPLTANYSVIIPSSSKSFNFTFFSEEVGNFSLPTLEYTYWYLGSKREGTLVLGNASFYKGVWAEYKVPDSVEEGNSFNIILNVYSDASQYITDVTIDIVLPQGLSFEDGSVEKSVSLNLATGKNKLELEVYASNPGEYQLISTTIKYRFNGRVSVFNMPEDLLPKVVIKENLLWRYWIYFIPMLLVALIFALYMRKKLYS